MFPKAGRENMERMSDFIIFYGNEVLLEVMDKEKKEEVRLH